CSGPTLGRPPKPLSTWRAIWLPRGGPGASTRDTSLPVPVVSGVPDSWQHVSAALNRTGFEPIRGGAERLYVGGRPDRLAGRRRRSGGEWGGAGGGRRRRAGALVPG